MGDRPPKKQVSIPEWQKQHEPDQSAISQQSSDTTSSETGNSTNSGGESAASSDLLEQARTFLSEESIKNASRERKIAFLEKKGLKADDIEKLLSPEANEDGVVGSDAGLKTIHDSTGPSTTSKAEPSTTTTTTEQPPSILTDPSTASAPRDVPPIITYPEFLLKPQKPPPLVTFERLAYAAYAFAGLSTLAYGASRWIVQPMLENLTLARQELADTALTDLQKLNEKLESSVSHVPYIASSLVLQKEQQQHQNEDAASVDSDPTELFHRDIGTQTSPLRSRSSSLSSTTDRKASDPTTQQSQQLQSLCSTLSSLVSSTSTSFTTTRLQTDLNLFQVAINDIELENNSFHNDYSYASMYTNLKVEDKSKIKKVGQQQKSEVEKFKTEIRSLKGALLSSRTFPTARPSLPGPSASMPNR